MDDSMVEKRSPSPSSSSSSHGGGGGGGGRKGIIRAGIMGVIVVILIGYLLMWIMMPTSAYLESWLTFLQSHTHSSFFEAQGVNILSFTLPVLLVAVLASVYLHFGTELNGSNLERRKHRLATWRKPLIIRGLGIVSWIELVVFAMFVGLVIWNLCGLLHFFFARIAEFRAPSDSKIWEARLGLGALTLGFVGNIALTFLFFPVTRGSSLLPLFGLTSEASVKYHIWLGHAVMAIFTSHGFSFIIYWICTDQKSEMVSWSKTRVSNVAGEISLLSGLILWVTTYPHIRRKIFELFFYTHYLYILFVLFYVLHLGIAYSFIMLPGFYLFLVDRYLRFLQSRRRVRLVSARILPCHAIELNFSKSQGLCYTPTSILYINVPSISKLQWHPFTISSSSRLDTELVSVVVKCEGTWTEKLCYILGPSFFIDRLEVSVEGPYGPASTQFLRHDALVMVSGGSGISPFISIIRELSFMHSTLKQKTPKLLLVSAFKNSSDLTMLDLLLPISDTHYSPLSTLELQIEAYVTREKVVPSTERQIASTPLRTIWFKPNTSDAPISPVLGRNSWLWLGTVIAFSFIIYLLLIGILTRYYIYPIDHDTDTIYSTSARAVLNMLFICISIVIAATAAFLWNKKHNAMESAKLIQDQGLNRNDKELESVPYDSLLQSTNTHYGRRPNLQKILLDCKEPSVGVLVCGPKEMRHEVANICSSSSAVNLHFESISFTW